MATPNVCILRAPGTNCDHETGLAFDRAGGRSQRVHIHELLAHPDRLQAFQVLCIPGGFSYGDDLGAGVVFASELRRSLNEALQQFLARDTLVLGICNGFQTLLKTGLLPAGAAGLEAGAARTSTLTWNANGKYTALWTRLNVAKSKCVFLENLTELELPIAHAEGRFLAEPSVVAELLENGQAVLRYTGSTSNGDVPAAAVLDYPANPNGSFGNIAGLTDPTGRILGLMPHPERYVRDTQHPQWTRRERRPHGDGFAIFTNAINYFT